MTHLPDNHHKDDNDKDDHDDDSMMTICRFANAKLEWTQQLSLVKRSYLTLGWITWKNHEKSMLTMPGLVLAPHPHLPTVLLRPKVFDWQD